MSRTPSRRRPRSTSTRMTAASRLPAATSPPRSRWRGSARRSSRSSPTRPSRAARSRGRSARSRSGWTRSSPSSASRFRPAAGCGDPARPGDLDLLDEVFRDQNHVQGRSGDRRNDEGLDPGLDGGLADSLGLSYGCQRREGSLDAEAPENVVIQQLNELGRERHLDKRQWVTGHLRLTLELRRALCLGTRARGIEARIENADAGRIPAPAGGPGPYGGERVIPLPNSTPQGELRFGAIERREAPPKVARGRHPRRSRSGVRAPLWSAPPRSDRQPSESRARDWGALSRSSRARRERSSRIRRAPPRCR